MDFGILSLIYPFLMMMLIFYISSYSHICKDTKLRMPFWILIILMSGISTWMKWDYPILKISIMATMSISILYIYYLSFRTRIKTMLDYLKLTWIILFLVEVQTIDIMRSLIHKGYANAFVNLKLVMRLDSSVDIFMLLFTILIAGIIYRNEKKERIVL